MLWALPLILVKEDLGLTIAALGAVVFLRGSRRWGVFAMVFGAVSFLVITALVLPALNGDTGGFADKYAPSGPSDALRILADGASSKVRTVLFLLIPTGFLALRSPMLLLVAVPTFALALPLRPADLLGPVVPVRRRPRADRRRRDDRGRAPAARTGARLRSGHRPGRRRPGHARAGAAAGVLAGVGPRLLADAARGGRVDRALDKIPTDSRVAASDNLGGRIALRTELYLVGDTAAPAGPPLPPSEFDEVEWVAFDRLYPLVADPGVAGVRPAAGHRRVRGGRRGRRSHRRPAQRTRVGRVPGFRSE